MIGKQRGGSVGGRTAILALVAALSSAGPLLPFSAVQGETAANSHKPEGGDKVVARMTGELVTEAELEKQVAEQLEQLEMQLLACQSKGDLKRYQILESALSKMMQDKILAAEAKEGQMSVRELVAAEVDGRIDEETTDAEVDAFYASNQSRIHRPKEQVALQIKQHLVSQRHDDAYAKLIDRLEKKYQVTVLLEAPRQEVAAIGPAKGPQAAPVTIVEFSDFQCPFCSQVLPTLERVREEYGDRVRLVYRQFPLSIHHDAEKAAEASLCADAQGKFWELHDKLFADQQRLSVDDLKAKATEIGLEADKFNRCLDSGQYAAEVKADLRAGTLAGVSGTPAFFVNGTFVGGAIGYEQLAKVIDEELERGRASMANGASE